MYQVVSDNDCYEQPLIAMIEADLEALYSKSQLPYVISHLSIDHLRQFMTEFDDGFFLELRFSHNELQFSNALSKWHVHLPDRYLEEYPDLIELAICEFRSGRLMEQLPVSRLEAYAKRWELPLWPTIQAYKAMIRDLHSHYQQVLAELLSCFYLPDTQMPKIS
jgi:hypothetical protein